MTYPCVEVEEISIQFAVPIWWNEANIGNTSDVLASSQDRRMVQDQGIEEADERSSLSTSGLI